MSRVSSVVFVLVVFDVVVFVSVGKSGKGSSDKELALVGLFVSLLRMALAFVPVVIVLLHFLGFITSLVVVVVVVWLKFPYSLIDFVVITAVWLNWLELSTAVDVFVSLQLLR